MRQFVGFGNGSDGDLVVSSNTTDAPIDSAATGAAAQKDLAATNAGFLAGQICIVIQMYGAGAGKWELNQIDSYVAGTITFTNNLVNTYVTGAQVMVLKQYRSVTINSGITLTGKSWNGTVGGILMYLVQGKVSGPGNISVAGVTGVGSSPTNNNITVGGGFRGGGGWRSSSQPAISGDGTSGLRDFINTPPTAYGNAGQGGRAGGGDDGGGGGEHAGGAVSGNSNQSGGTQNGGYRGDTAGLATLIEMVMGGGGGGGRTDDAEGGHGGSGAGIIAIFCDSWELTGTTNLNGGNGYAVLQASGGGGAGGAFFLKARRAILGSGLITLLGGSGGVLTNSQSGGNGGVGRARVEACFISGDTTPSASKIQGGHQWCAVSHGML